MHSLRRSPTLNIAKKAGGSGGEGCCHYSARAIWPRLYIENMQSVMSQCISLSSVWHLSSLLPSMGCSLLFWLSAALMILLFLASPHQDYRHLVEQNGSAATHITPRNFPLPPAPSLTLPFSLPHWLRQAGLSLRGTAWWIIANLLSFWNESSLPPFSCVCK